MNSCLECRTCLGHFTGDLTINVETTITEQISIRQAIEQIASVEVSKQDVLPRQICKQCFQSLESALTFRKQIIVSDIELKKRHQFEAFKPISNENKDWLSESNNRDDRKNYSVEETEVHNKDYKLEVKEESIQTTAKLLNDDFDDIRSRTPDFEDSGSDWSNFNNENVSSEDAVENTKPKKVFRRTTTKKTRSPLSKARRKRNSVKKPLKKVSDTSSDDSDSDVPLEELRKEVQELENKTGKKVRKKREKRDVNNGPILCPICGKLFKAKQNFNSHMTTVHRKKSEKPDKISCLCPDCGRVITGTRQNFVAHRRYHHSDKAQVKQRFSCDICPRKFYREKNLIIHQRTHKGEKGYICELCPDKSYTQIGGLILHKRKVHLKKPTCTCNYCGKQFYEKHYLETHIRQWHTGERPFSCEICGKAFSCNGTLLRHRKDSHGEKQPCPKCGKMYTEGELRKHLKRHKIREEGIKRKKYTCEYCGTEMNFTSRKRHLLKQHGIMLRGRGENAERVPITRADAM